MKKTSKILVACMLLVGCFAGILTFSGCLGVINPLLSISLTTPIKDHYKVGEEIDLNGATLRLTYEDGTQKSIAVDPEMISGFSTETAGTYTMKIVFNEKETTQEYVVYDFQSVLDNAKSKMNSLSKYQATVVETTKRTGQADTVQNLTYLADRNYFYTSAQSGAISYVDCVDATARREYNSVSGTTSIDDTDVSLFKLRFYGIFFEQIGTITSSNITYNASNETYELNYTVSYTISEETSTLEMKLVVFEDYRIKTATRTDLSNDGSADRTISEYTYSYEGLPTVSWPTSGTPTLTY